MSAQAAGKIAAQAGKAAGKAAEGHVLKKGAKRDPELYVRTFSRSSLRFSPPTCQLAMHNHSLIF